MIKMVALLKRRDDVDPDAFRDHYEKGHVALVESVAGAWMADYRRSYVRHETVIAGVSQGGTDWRPDFDVLTEIWFASQEDHDRAMSAFREPANVRLIADDEEKFLDRSRKRMFLVDERTNQPKGTES